MGIASTIMKGGSAVANRVGSTVTSAATDASLKGSTLQAGSDAGSAGNDVLATIGQISTEEANTAVAETKIGEQTNNAITAAHDALKANQTENKVSENVADGVKELA